MSIRASQSQLKSIVLILHFIKMRLAHLMLQKCYTGTTSSVVKGAFHLFITCRTLSPAIKNRWMPFSSHSANQFNLPKYSCISYLNTPLCVFTDCKNIKLPLTFACCSFCWKTIYVNCKHMNDFCTATGHFSLWTQANYSKDSAIWITRFFFHSIILKSNFIECLAF